MKFPPALLVVLLLLSNGLMNSFGQAVDASNLDKDVKSATLHSVGDAAPEF